MPNRIIKESLLISESYAQLSLQQRDLFIRLIVAADDFGRYDARPQVIRGRLMPLEEVTVEEVGQWLQDLARYGLIDIYEVDGRPYLWLTGWERHQNIRAKRSKFPVPGNVNASASNCMQVQADVSVIQSESKSESESESRPPDGFVPPTVMEVSRFCKDKALSVDAERFCAFYEAKRWRVSGAPVRDWRTLVRLWDRGSPASTGPPAPARVLIQAAYTQRPHHESSPEEDADRFMGKFR